MSTDAVTDAIASHDPAQAAGRDTAPARAARLTHAGTRPARRHVAGAFRAVFHRTIGWALFLAAWYLVTAFGLVRTSYLSPPQDVLRSLVRLFSTGEIWTNLLPSLQRSVTGLAAGIVVGVTLGVALGWFKTFERIVDPVLQFFRQLSAFALFPVFILFLGIGELSKVGIIFWAAFWPILLNTIDAVKNVERLQINAARSMGASQWFVFAQVVLPASVPRIMTGVRLGGAYSITALVAAEMIGAPSGLGIFVLTSQQVFHIPDMYAGIVVLALLGLAFNYALAFVEHRLTRWQTGIVNG